MVVVGCQPLTGESMRWIKDTVSGLSNPHDASARNRISKMQKYVQQGGDVNKPNKLGDTPLHEACAYIRDNGESSKNSRKRKNTARDRRKVGKKMSSRRGFAEGGPLEMLELLLTAGSDINAQNIVGDAPLHKAALNGRALSADFLIRAGADVNIRNEFSQTPLHAACVSGNIEVVQRLVQGGADTSAQDAAEDTPFHEACRHQYEGIVIYLMGLVNKPETSQGLKLWQGLNPSWEKMLRSRAQAVQGQVAEPPSSLSTAGAGSNPAGIILGTPSTIHNSSRSVLSARGSVYTTRTPGRNQLSGGGGSGKVGGGAVAINVRPAAKTDSLSPTPFVATSNSTQQYRHPEPILESGPAGADRSQDSGKHDGGGYRLARTHSKRSRREQQQQQCFDAGEEKSVSRTFSTGAVDVLNWQATKVKNTKQGQLIEKAREALREEQNEAAMAMSTTTLGDDDASIDTIISAETPSTFDNPRTPRAGKRPSTRLKDNYNPVSEDNVTPIMTADTRMTRVLNPKPSRLGIGGTVFVGTLSGQEIASPTPPTPPTSGSRSILVQAPSREGVRRGSYRKSKSKNKTPVVVLQSPSPRPSRRISGSPIGFLRDDIANSAKERTLSHQAIFAEPGRGGVVIKSAGSSRRPQPEEAINNGVGRSVSGESGSGTSRPRLNSASRSSSSRRPPPSAGDASTAEVSSSGRGAYSENVQRRHSRRKECFDFGGGRGGGRRGESKSSPRRHREREVGAGGDVDSRSSPKRSDGDEGSSSKKENRRHRSRRQGSENRAEEESSSHRSYHRRRKPGSERLVVKEGEEKPSSRLGGMEEPTSDRRLSKRSDSERSKRSGGGGSSGGSSSGTRDSRRHVRSSAESEGSNNSNDITAARQKSQRQLRQPTTIAEEVVNGNSAQSMTPTRTPLRKRDILAARLLGQHGHSKSAVDVTKTSNKPLASSRVGRGVGEQRPPPVLVPKRRSGGHALRPPSWAAEVITGLEDVVPPSKAKKVVSYDLPQRRSISPCVSTNSPANGPPNMGGVPRARWSSKQFFRPGLSLSPTPPPPPATSNTTSVGCYAVLCPEESSVEAGRKSRVAADVARKEVEAVEATKRERESMTSANAAGRQQIQTRSSFSKAPPSALPVILTKVSPVGSTEDDAPPSMDSLQRDTSASMMVVVTEKRRSSRKLVRKGEGDTPATAEKDSTWAVSPDNVVKKAAMKMARIDAIFSDSDSDDDDQPSSAGWTSRSSEIRDSSSEAALSALRAISSLGFTAIVKELDPRDEDVEMTLEEPAGGASSTVAVNRSGSRGVLIPPATTAIAPGSTSTFLRAESKMNKSALPEATATVAPGGGPTERSLPPSKPTPTTLEGSLEVSANMLAAVFKPKPTSVVVSGYDVGGTLAADAGRSMATTIVEPSAAPRSVLSRALGSPKSSQKRLQTEKGQRKETVGSEMAGVVTAAEPSRNAPPAPVAFNAPPSPKPTLALAPVVIATNTAATVIEMEEVATKPSVVPPYNAVSTTLRASPLPPPAAAPSPIQSKVVGPPALLGAGRGRLTLGRPGTVPAKVSMPIVGGRAAWNKFLAEAGPDGSPDKGEKDAAQALSKTRNVEDEEGDAEGKDEDRLAEKVAVLETKGPRGFKEPISVDGPNKGPAGAFSGNSMWRLSNNTATAANRMQSGIAANGHGGYSNPLAAMRAGNSPAAARRSAGGLAVGGGVANPLAGFRGAAGMGGAGVANPLARGGRRPTGGGLANPMLGRGGVMRIGVGGAQNSTTNPLAAARSFSKAGGGVSLPRGAHGGFNRDKNGNNDKDGDNAPSLQHNPVSLAAQPSTSYPRGEGHRASTGKVEQNGVATSSGINAEETNRPAAAADSGCTGEGVEFRALGNNGGLYETGVVLTAHPRGRARALQQIEAENTADRNPGQAKVANAVMAFQKNSDPRNGLVVEDPRYMDMSNMAEQGLVQLRRVKYSPRPAAVVEATETP